MKRYEIKFRKTGAGEPKDLILMQIPQEFSTAALEALECLKDNVYLYFNYKTFRFYLTNADKEIREEPDYGPHWAGDNLEDLEAWLEKLALDIYGE